MAGDENSPVYLVDPNSDPVLIRICGRASYQNSAPLTTFFQKMMANDQPRFRLDFSQCTTMDSTFLGIIAGAALAARKHTSKGEFIIAALSKRNLELFRNLGLHRLTTIEATSSSAPLPSEMKALKDQNAVNRKTILQAHETLSGLDESNRAKFQDVVTFLRAEQEED
jgi:anti-sigma B factor antagonist